MRNSHKHVKNANVQWIPMDVSDILRQMASEGMFLCTQFISPPFSASFYSLSFLSLRRKLFITLSGLIRYREKHLQPKKENKTQTTLAPTTLLPSHHIISYRYASNRIASHRHRHNFDFILVIFIATWTWAKTALTICWCVHFNTSCVGCCSFLLYTLSVCAVWFDAGTFFPRTSARKNAHAATIFAYTLERERESEG